MVMGGLLRERDQQYVANHDEQTQTWRILDTWHDDLKHLDIEDEIPDDSPAVTILTEGGFIALIKEAGRLGVLQNASIGGTSPEYEEELAMKDQEIEELKTAKNHEIERLTKRMNTSEDYALKEKAMEAILKLTAMSDMSNLTDKE